MKHKLTRSIIAALWVVPTFAASISIQPSSLTVLRGQDFFLDVSASDLTDLYAFQFDLGFTPGLLSAISISEGSFLPSRGGTVFIPGTIDNARGTVSFVADTLVGALPGVSGSGPLATVQFRAVGLGTSGVSLSNVTLLDSTLSPISATTVAGTIDTAVPEPNTSLLLLLGGGVFCALLHCGRGVFRETPLFAASIERHAIDS